MMEAILSRLQALSAEELRAEVLEAGIKCGPITNTTRGLFQKKLALAILEKQGGSSDSPDSGGSTSENCPNAENVREEADVGYNLGLNPPGGETSAGTAPVAPCLDTTTEATVEPPSLFYGVCPSEEDELDGSEEVHVYVSKKEAMKAMMKMKGARFKIFSNREDAVKFSKGTCDSCFSPEKTTPERSPGKADRPAALEVESLNGERANNYKAPRTQELTAKLRNAVEKGDLADFREMVWSNPRYLIGSGDNPTIVQEGCRYNALHVAAKENQPIIAQLLLDTLEDPEFMRLMYPDDQEAMLQERIRYIVDLYLNTPDKAAFETPLHFACKFGCPEVVNVLCSHPETDKNRKNKYNQKPVSIICERKNKSQEIKQKIKDYLEDRFYVPLLRAADNSAQPAIGAPWSPEPSDPIPHWSGPGLAGSPKDPVMLVKAFVGPLTKSKAEEFRRMWKMPPRDRSAYFHHILKSDPDRGVERVGRELAHELGYPWAEYWEFLGTFTNLCTEDGLKLLEEYLSRKECKAKENRHDECDGTAQTQGGDIRENKQKDTISCSPGSFVTDSLKPEKNHQDWLCSPLEKERGPKAERLDQDHVSPVSNLMSEFERVSVLELGGRTQESGLRDPGSEEVCSSSSDEYFTADESDEEDACRKMTGAHSVFWDLKQKDLDSSSSSSSSYKSLQCSKEDLRPKTPPADTCGLFIDGESPTKLDCEVLFAIRTVDIDPQKYPCTDRWKSTIQGYTSSQMQRWPSPGGGTQIANWVPGSPTSPVLSCGSPVCPRPVHSVLIQNLCQKQFRKPAV